MDDSHERCATEHLGLLEVLTLIFSVYVLIALFIFTRTQREHPAKKFPAAIKI